MRGTNRKFSAVNEGDSSDGMVQKCLDKIEELESQVRQLKESSKRPSTSRSGDNRDRYIKMKRFTGEEDMANGGQWIESYEKTANLFGWSDQWKRGNFVLHIDGEAHSWYCAYGSKQDTWSELKEVFSKRYVSSKKDYWVQMLSAKWNPKTESLGKFYSRMCTLGGLCGFEESYIIHQLKRSMPSEYRRLISVCKADTLSAWFEEMLSIVNADEGHETSTRSVALVGTSESVDGQSSQERLKKRRLRCFVCQSERHLMAACPKVRRLRAIRAEGEGSARMGDAGASGSADVARATRAEDRGIGSQK